jgi:hypothetical protein
MFILLRHTGMASALSLCMFFAQCHVYTTILCRSMVWQA